MKWALPLLSGALIAAYAGGAGAAEVAPSAVKFENGVIAEPLTDRPGDPARGRDVFMGRKQGNCLACHANSDMADQPFHGEVGPPLDGVADRWSPTELRAIIVNAKTVFTDATIMPAFYRDSGFYRAAEDFQGKTILTAQQVEDVIAYLMTLKE